MRDVAEGAGFNWSITNLPTDLLQPQVSVHGPAFSLFQSTPEKQLAAWLFLKWFTAPEQQARWARTFGVLPVRASTVDFLEGYIVENPRYDIALGLLAGEVTTEPGMVGYGECREVMREMLSAIANRGEPAPWLEDTARICDNSLE